MRGARAGEEVNRRDELREIVLSSIGLHAVKLIRPAAGHLLGETADTLHQDHPARGAKQISDRRTPM